MLPLARCRMDGQLCSPACSLHPSSTNEGDVPGCIKTSRDRCFQPAVNCRNKTSKISKCTGISLALNTSKCPQPSAQRGGPHVILGGTLKHHSKVSSAPQTPGPPGTAALRNPRPPQNAAAKSPLSRSNPGALKIRQPASFRFPLFFSRSPASHPFFTRPRYSRSPELDPLAAPSPRRTLRTSLSFRRAQLAKNLHSSRQAKRTSAQSTSFDDVSYNPPRQTRILGQDGSC